MNPLVLLLLRSLITQSTSQQPQVSSNGLLGGAEAKIGQSGGRFDPNSIFHLLLPPNPDVNYYGHPNYPWTRARSRVDAEGNQPPSLPPLDPLMALLNALAKSSALESSGSIPGGTETEAFRPR